LSLHHQRNGAGTLLGSFSIRGGGKVSKVDLIHEPLSPKPLATLTFHSHGVFYDVFSWLDSLFKDATSPEVIASLLNAAFQIADLEYGESEALEWAEEFSLPGDIISYHTNLFINNNYDIYSLISQLKDSIAGNRISEGSILETISPDNEELNRLLLLVDGMPLFPAPEFIPNGPHRLPPLSNSYLRLSPVVNRMLFEDFIDKGLAFVLPKSLVMSHVPEFHLSRLSWTVKHGKKKGRPILDCSAGDPSVNSDFTKLSCDARWGVIHHPTIADFVNMIMQFWEDMLLVDPNLNWSDDLVLWKIDLKGAYTLISFEDAAIPFMAAEMKDDSIIFFLCGVFGWSGTPASFQVITRALMIQINASIQGRVSMYVDDLLGVSLRRYLHDDIQMATSICCRLFRSDCIEASKTEYGRVISVIGYTINLDLGIVSIATKNYLRVIYGLSSLSFEEKIPIKVLQKFASWVSRYSVIATVLKPLTKNIYDSFAGFKNQYVHISLDEQMVLTLRLFRAIFLLSIAREDLFTRPLTSFKTESPQLVIEFDASLFGCGALLYDVSNHETDEVLLGSVSFSSEIWEFGDRSEFQNTAEFTAAVVGLIIAMKFCGQGTRVGFRGDSMSALRWLETGKFRSSLITKLATLFTYLCLRHRFHICESCHIGAEDNTTADYLSRHFNGQLGDLVIDVNPILLLVDPKVPITSDVQYIQFWNELPVVVNKMLDAIEITYPSLSSSSSY
jgi:hypothetical protein